MADPTERLRAMLHQISWHAADAASHPDRTVAQLRAELRRIAAIADREAGRLAPGPLLGVRVDGRIYHPADVQCMYRAEEGHTDEP